MMNTTGTVLSCRTKNCTSTSKPTADKPLSKGIMDLIAAKATIRIKCRTSKDMRIAVI